MTWCIQTHVCERRSAAGQGATGPRPSRPGRASERSRSCSAAALESGARFYDLRRGGEGWFTDELMPTQLCGRPRRRCRTPRSGPRLGALYAPCLRGARWRRQVALRLTADRPAAKPSATAVLIPRAAPGEGEPGLRAARFLLVFRTIHRDRAAWPGKREPEATPRGRFAATRSFRDRSFRARVAQRCRCAAQGMPYLDPTGTYSTPLILDATVTCACPLPVLIISFDE